MCPYLETSVAVIVVSLVAVASPTAGHTASINGDKEDQIGGQEENAQHQGDAQGRFVGPEEAQHVATTCSGHHRVVVVARFRRHDVGIHQSPVAPDPCCYFKRKRKFRCLFFRRRRLVAMATAHQFIDGGRFNIQRLESSVVDAERSRGTLKPLTLTFLASVSSNQMTL